MSSLHRKRNLFNIQRLLLLGLMALVLCTSLALTAGVASAQTASAARSYVNPITAGCATDAQTTEWNVGAIPGILGMTATIYLRYSPYCQVEWAKIVLDHPLPAGYEVNAIVTSNINGQQYDCTTGDGVVTANETSCYSGMVFRGSTAPVYPAYAAAMYHVIGERWLEFTRTVSY